MLIAGVSGPEETLLVVSLTEELRRLGHRVGRAEARGDVLVVALASGGRVTAAPPADPRAWPDALGRLARSLDPQLELLLVEGPERRETDELPVVEVVVPRGASLTAPGTLLAAASGADSARDLALLVERRVLGGAAGRSLDAAVGRRRARRPLGRALGAALHRALAVLGRAGRRG